MQVKATFIHWDTSSDEGEEDPFGWWRAGIVISGYGKNRYLINTEQT